MYSRSLRLGVVFLALAQLGVWGFYAPAHRLMHHSHPIAAKTSQSVKCHTGCCSKHSKCVRPTSDPSDGPSRCPKSSDDCGFCIIALQSGSPTNVVALTESLTLVEILSETAPPCETVRRARLFDSRGPPSA